MNDTPSDLRFEFEWEAAEGVRTPELAATWCRLQIWVGTDCISLVEDRESGSSRRSVYCSLYPLAEWIAYNWWAIQADSRPTALRSDLWSFSQLRHTGKAEHGWLRHHNLRASGDGFIWPNMTILPLGSRTRLIWVGDREVASSWPIRFINSGESIVETTLVQRSLSDLVESVIVRLAEQGVHQSALFEEWSANSRLTRDERDFCLATARLGLDPYAAPSSVSENLVEVSKRLEESLLDDFLDAVDPSALTPGLEWLEQSSRILEQATDKEDERIVDIRRAVKSIRSDSSLPWVLGFAQADRARRALDLAPTDPITPEEMMNVHTLGGSDRGLQGLGGWSETHALTLILRASTSPADAAKRFASARAFWHFVAQPERRRFLLTPTRTDDRMIERSFAAELLAPAAGLQQQLGGRPGAATDDELDAAALHYGVSPLLIRHQVENQLLGANATS